VIDTHRPAYNDPPGEIITTSVNLLPVARPKANNFRKLARIMSNHGGSVPQWMLRHGPRWW
jgi:hypothetical protein